MNEINAVVVSEYGNPDVLEYTSVELPDLQANEVLIRVEAISVNFADVKARMGNYHGASGPPFVPGLDCAGIIEAVGDEVKDLQIGQKVIALPQNGTYASYVIADERLIYPISAEVDSTEAAAIATVGITSYNLLKKVARISSGESVLIHGAAGGVGTVAIQMAKILGASTVIGTVGSDDKVSIAKQAGADHVINYQKESFDSTVNHLTNQKGIDIILDSYAGEMFEKGFNCLARFGRMVTFGNAMDSAGGKVSTDMLHSTCRAVLGYSTGTYRNHQPEELAEAAQATIKFLEEGKVDVLIDEIFPLKDANKAHVRIEGRKSTGKIVLVP